MEESEELCTKVVVGEITIKEEIYEENKIYMRINFKEMKINRLKERYGKDELRKKENETNHFRSMEERSNISIWYKEEM